MAGKGTECGRSFEEIAKIIDGVKYNEKLSVCFDTCHTHDAGYDLVNDFDGVLNEFDKIVGINRLKFFILTIAKMYAELEKTVMKILVLVILAIRHCITLCITHNLRTYQKFLKRRM